MQHVAIGGGEALIALASFVIGVATCFFGYRLFRMVLVVLGFVYGFSLGWTLCAASGPVVATAAAIVLGLVLGGIAELLYAAGVFLAGAGLGLMIAIAVTGLFSVVLSLIAGLIIGVAAGALALTAQKAVIIWSTALYGGWSLVMGILALRGQVGQPELYPPGHHGWGTLLLWVIVSLAGVLVQYAVTSHGVHHRRR